jgi:hypothetical protein
MERKVHNVQAVQADEKYLSFIVDGASYRVPWEQCSPKLKSASLAERQHLIVSPSGYGIHWLEIDEDLAISPLLKIAETISSQTA